ncbi:MAG: hypothetical protein B9J98_04940 [Candidatus Terraquivivens tikiterensis]|uniref:Uncharacterized protein n=1 Tax=Candidatus Terraquivivens tikiterensis TaxID=1980982 RepID=A0A2R7Y373_9ARCH|nr:MAG: hypothetical protein B9J98_04940 [Candidatus Terraquivivens tikiterensis]
MRLGKAFGLFLMLASVILTTFYAAWFFGLISGLDPELAVRVPILIIVLFFFFVVGWTGYVMYTTPMPRSIRRG